MSSKIDFERTLSRIARSLPGEPLPPALRENTLNRLPLSIDKKPERTISWFKLMAGALAFIAFLAICWFSTIIFRLKDPGAQALAAIQQANTWHINGWKIQGGVRDSWEVWGRRKPFFYYEKLGDLVTYDDGHQRIQVIPRDVSPMRRSVVLKTPSQPNGENDGLGYTNIVRGWHSWNRPKATTGHDYLFETFDYGADFLGTGLFGAGFRLVTHNLTYVNKRTFYPYRIQESMSIDDRKPRTLVEDVKIELNKRLPLNIAAPQWPASYVVLDATEPRNTTSIPKENVSYSDGLSAQVTPVAMDKQGNVLLRARGWIGNKRLCAATVANFEAFTPASQSALPRASWPCHDNNGRDYVLVQWPMSVPGVPSVSGDQLLLFAPASPIKPGESLPQELTVSLSISAFTNYPLYMRDMRWTLPLASAPLMPSFDQFWAQINPNWRQQWLGISQATFPAAADQSRAWYWLWQEGPYQTDKAAFARCVAWQQRAVADSPPFSEQAQNCRLALAWDYAQWHQYTRGRQELQEVITISKQHSNMRHPAMWSYYREQAETTLRGWDRSKLY